MNKKPGEHKKRILAYLEKNPDATHKQYVEASGHKTSTAYFSQVRSLYKRPVKTGDTAKETREYNRKGLYLSIFRTPVQNMPEAAKTILRNFLEALNKSKHTKLEMVQYADPSEIEIREFR